MNVIVICLDTLRWDFLGCYGNKQVHTPCLDAFSRYATRFDRAFCGSFPTVPMRVDAYTGTVNWPRYGWRGPEPDQPLLPQILRDNGYHAGLVLDTQNNVGAGLHTAFDEYELIKKPEDDGVRPEDITVPWPREKARQDSGGYVRDRVRTSHYRHETDWFVTRTMTKASEWLEDNRKRGKFLLWVDTFEIHEDWRAPDYLTEMYSPACSGIDYSYPNYGHAGMYAAHELARLRARYAAEVTLTDKWVGLLLRAVEDMGLLANTMVVITSDHGMYLGEHGLVGKHTVDPEWAWPLFDTVARVPLLVSLPGSRTPRATQALVQAADLMPSVLDVCGIPFAAKHGRSWLPVLERKKRKLHRHIFTSCHSWNGPGRINYLPSQITVNTAEWCLSVGPTGSQTVLFDRVNDPEQQTNVASQLPEQVLQLRRELADFMLEAGAEPAYVDGFALGKDVELPPSAEA